MLRTSFLFVAAFWLTGLHAQQADGFQCVANPPAELQRHLDANPGAWERAMEAKAQLDAHTLSMVGASAQRQVYPITVVLHIIHNNGPENVSDAQVHDAIRILNEDFNKQNPDWVNVRPEFLDVVGNVGIQFTLARKDPWGNCTNGITRTQDPLTSVGDFDMTQLIQWPRERYMNVWVCAYANGAAGYTYYPMWLHNWPEADGMVVRHDYLGSIGTGSPGRSRVLSHEVGHWLNLMHCWGDGNDPGFEENCFMDDEVDDTPLTKGWTSCYLVGSSCGSTLDNVENYMEYSYCGKMFTHGQGDRMIAALTSPIAQRNQLWQSTTLEANGMQGTPTLCEAAMAHGRVEICAGDSIRFTDASYHGVTSRQWTFAGGTPNNSAAIAPFVTYAEPGTYTVELQVSDGNSAQTLTRVGLVRVLPQIGYTVPWIEGFETGTLDGNDDWLVHNPDPGPTWEVTNAAAFNGYSSLRLINGPAQAVQKDDLYSTTLDMSQTDSIRLTFRYAFARRNGGNDDRLRVYVSNNCGETWGLRAQLRGSHTLNTMTGVVLGDFVPSGRDEWREALVANISSNYLVPHFRIRFEFESNGGNHIYLDDININGAPVGIADLDNWDDVELQVVPNPAREQAMVHITLTHSNNVQLDLLDATGRLLRVLPSSMHAAGTGRIPLPLAGLAPGLYLLNARIGDRVRSVRFAVE